jgi:hypothetical protein
MGNGEWRPPTISLQRSKQAKQQAHCSLTQNNDCVHLQFHDQIEIAAHPQMTEQFGGRTESDAQATDELGCGS